MRDFGKDDDKAGKDKDVLRKKAHSFFMKDTNINSLGDRIGTNRIKYKRLVDMEEKNLYRR